MFVWLFICKTVNVVFRSWLINLRFYSPVNNIEVMSNHFRSRWERKRKDKMDERKNRQGRKQKQTPAHPSQTCCKLNKPLPYYFSPLNNTFSSCRRYCICDAEYCKRGYCSMLKCTLLSEYLPFHMLFLSHITRKPVFGVPDQVRLKPVCSATEVARVLKFWI